MRRVGPGTRAGFALGLVVLMLFAIGLAGVAGFQVVSNEFVLATHNRDGLKALAVARAGLQRYVGESIGTPQDSVSYAIGDGIATVTRRKVLGASGSSHLYYVRAEGTVTDERTPNSPARRSVATYAWHRIAPVNVKGAVMIRGGTLQIRNSAEVRGQDIATSAQCLGAPSTTLAGGISGSPGSVSSTSGGQLLGSPGSITYSSAQAVYDTVGVRWDILQDPNFPVEYEETPPNWASLPSTEYPVIRKQGNLTTSAPWGTYASPGRGVLIVTGTLTLANNFGWDGIILAGSIADVMTTSWNISIDGAFIGNLDSPPPGGTVQWRAGVYRYQSCHVAAANLELSYIEVVPNSDFEVTS